MNTPKRSLLYVIRKRSRTLLLFVILLVVSTLVLSGLSIMDAAGDSSAELRESTGASFTVQGKMDETAKSQVGNNTYEYKQSYLSDDMIQKIAAVDGIKDFNSETYSVLALKNQSGDYLETIVYTNWYDDPTLKYGALVKGITDSSYSSLFSLNNFQLVEGRHITKDDKYTILMSKELAEKLNYKVGDKINLSTSEYLMNYNQDSASVNNENTLTNAEVEIIGLFNISGEQSDRTTLAQYELYENYIYADMTSYKEACSGWPEVAQELNQGYASVDFLVTDPAQLSNIMSEVSNISSINWDNFTLTANDEVYQASSSSMSNIEKLITTMIVVVVIIAAVIVTLILSMWVRSRVRETGILMSTGIAKYKIVAQFVLETVLIAVFAFTISYFTSNAIAGNLGHIIDSTIAAGDVQVAMSRFILVCCAGIAVILAAIGISSIPVMRMKPREILSKMS
ncbi:MAG: ABC transporter permease [Lachnospiraceae bacterium]